MFFQAAAEGGFALLPALVGILIVVGGPLFLYWRSAHCPTCKRIFVRELVKTEKNLLQKLLQSSEVRHYRCKNCGTQWSKKVHLGN